MKVAFRADASIDIGTGHVMRCLTLADALRERGATCSFACRAHSGNLIDLIRQRGFEAAALPPAVEEIPTPAADSTPLPAHAHWLGADWETDANQTRVALGGERVDWLVVDHYAIDEHWERVMRPACRRLTVIDDLADRVHDCDLLLDQNLGRSAAGYAGLVPIGCPTLAGPQYALLRPEFAALRPYSLARRESPQLKRLLITMGGVDKGNATGEVLEALRYCPLPPDCGVTVVMGSRAPWLDQVRMQAVETSWSTEVLIDVRDMARLMAESDLAVGAAGTTAWERCCLGLPAITIILAPNQKAGAVALRDAGAILLVPQGAGFAAALAAQIGEVIGTDLLTKISVACRAITNGTGAMFLAELMTNEQS